MLAGACLALLGACGERQATLQLAGQSMGTSWHVTVIEAPGTPSTAALQAGIEGVLEAVEASMSTYRRESEISRFNRAPPGEWQTLSGDFYTVLAAALEIGAQSGGAYDVTVAPLVELWGFGAAGGIDEPPPEQSIREMLERVGQQRLQLDGERQRVRKLGEVSLDLSSIAKGYAVDRIAGWLVQQGMDRYLVEVGGEMKLSGLSMRGDPWRIAIEKPAAGGRSVAVAVSLTDVGVATSGDYRNFFEAGGRRYSHTIDPRTGYPVDHELVSVTVVHPSAMTADAWATALTVLGPADGAAVAEARALAVYFITRKGKSFEVSHTPAFEPYLKGAGPAH
jgi:thiamine biosynthesis lipoprotein